MSHSIASFTDLQALISAAVALRLRAPGVDADVPLSRLGFDSLACIELAADLEAALGLRIPADAVTEWATVRSLCAAIANDSSSSTFDLIEADALLPGDIQPCLGQRISSAEHLSLTTARHILLTGATGFLGSELLDRLIARTSARVTCLVRGPLRTHHGERVEIVGGDLTAPRIGISQGDWERLTATVDCVCHAGASINWVGSYEALRLVNTVGTREMLRFACEANASFHFISSISVCYSRQVGSAAVDESLDPLTVIEGLHFGYAQTKAVAESLVREAGARGLHVRITRPALITGDSRTGRFNPSDMLTALIAGCVRMGAAPDLDWRLDALPVDTLADLIVSLPATPDPTIHLVHPQPRHWRECVLWMRLYGYDVRLMPYREWTARLCNAPADHPLRALRSFFLEERDRGLTIPELHEETRRPRVGASRSAAIVSNLDVAIPPLDARLLDTYFAAFIRDGALPPPKSVPPRGGRHMHGSPTGHRRPWLPPSGGREIAQRLLREAGLDTADLTITPLGAADSIISELTAWRSGGATGLFEVRAGERRYVLKIKPHSDDAQAVGEALAGICDQHLEGAYHVHGRGLGLDRGHERELMLYRDADAAARRYMPRAIATRADRRTQTWAVLLEYIDDAILLDSVDRPDMWTREHIETAIDGLAALHAAWHRRVVEVRRQSWLGHVRSTRSMQLMTPLWRALADHASPMFAAWTTNTISTLQHDLLDRIGEWRPALERLPQTVIHNDFNPRNLCLRNRDGCSTLCAFDWELATIGAPVRDLAEFLCFVLPPGVDADVVDALIDRHRRAFAQHASVEPNRARWRAGFNAALCELLVDRLSVYAMVHRVRAQRFLPRVLRTWTTLYAMSREPSSA